MAGDKWMDSIKKKFQNKILDQLRMKDDFIYIFKYILKKMHKWLFLTLWSLFKDMLQ
jgi:hypothetical protein